MALKTNKKFAAAAVLAAATAVTAAAGLTLRQSVKVYADGGQPYTSLCANYSGKSSEAFHNGLDAFQLGKQHIKVKCNGQEAEAGGLCDAADETDGGSAFTADMQNGKLTLDLELGEELDGAVLSGVTLFFNSVGYTAEYFSGDGNTFSPLAATSTTATDEASLSYHRLTLNGGQPFSVLRIEIYGGYSQRVSIKELDVNFKNEPKLITDERDRAMQDVYLPSLFTDHMILKQRTEVKVWGYGGGADGNAVTVEFGGQTKTATVKDYQWQTTLNAPDAGGGYELKVTGAHNSVTVKDVAVGEVFIAAGQSNMQRTVGRLDGATDEDYIKGYGTEQIKELKETPNKDLRLFNQSSTNSRNEELKDVASNGWSIADFDSAYDFSAVGYFFGRELQRRLGVPVGIIYAAVGGTRIQAFYSRQALLATDDEELENERQECLNFYAGDSPKYGSASACNYYNGMVKPLMPYSVSGVLWYQGESNVGDYKIYHKLLKIMQDCWREGFDDPDLPFLVSQLAPLDKSGYNQHRIAVMQAEMQYFLHNTYMTVISDTPWEEGNTNIHPQNKIPVAERLCLLARQFVYGEDINSLPPLFKSVVYDGDTAFVSFSNAESGLKADDGGDVTGFEISEDGKTFIPATATVVGGNKIAVWNGGVQQPKYVRYGYDRAFSGNLVCGNGLPVSIFSTDLHLLPDDAERQIISPVKAATVEVYADLNGKLKLPANVQVTSGGKTTSARVCWNAYDIDLSKESVYEIKGYTAEGRYLVTTAKITVCKPTVNVALTSGLSVGGAVVIAGGATAAIILIKRKKKR